MRIARADLLTPANAMSVAGLILTIIGSGFLDSMPGIILVVLGRLLDVADGPVARRTHASEFGAFLDAASDKLAIAVLVLAAFLLQQAPLGFLLFVLVQNSINAVLGLYAIAKHQPLQTSILGKRSMFFQISTLILTALSIQVPQAYIFNVNSGFILFLLAVAAMALSMVLGVMATFRYFQQALDIKDINTTA